jgi:hypothetical protein
MFTRNWNLKRLLLRFEKSIKEDVANSYAQPKKWKHSRTSKIHPAAVFLSIDLSHFETWTAHLVQDRPYGPFRCSSKKSGIDHRNLKSASKKVKTWGESARGTYVRQTWYNKLNVPATIFHGTVFKICIFFGCPYLTNFFSYFCGFILLPGRLRFLWDRPSDFRQYFEAKTWENIFWDC